jgi:hypothetical protein
MMSAETSGWGVLVHIDNTIRHKNESGRRGERLTFLQKIRKRRTAAHDEPRRVREKEKMGVKRIAHHLFR